MKRIHAILAAKQAMSQRKIALAAAVAIALGAGARQSSAAVISVNFAGGQVTIASATSAGLSAIAEPGSKWNQVDDYGQGNGNGPSGGPFSLNDDQTSGVATLNYSGGGVWSITNNAAQSTNGNYQLLDGYFYSGGGTTAATATVTNLTSTYTANGYSVYVYFDSASTAQTGTVSVSGSPTVYDFTAQAASTGASTASNSDLIQTTDSSLAYPVANYAVFTGLTSPNFTISFVTTSSISGRAGISGFQVVAAPEPCSAAMITLSATTLLLRRRNRERTIPVLT